MSTFFDGVKSSLNALFERIGGDDGGPVRELSAEEIRRELERRAATRKSPVVDNPLAKRAAATMTARSAREKMAREREARVHGTKRERAEARTQAHEAAFREAQRRAAQEYAQFQARARQADRAGSAGATGGSARRAPGRGASEAIAKHYKTLDLPQGASFDDVKRAFRALMRKYHPDMHSGNPQKQKAASELSKQMTEAYNELEKHLLGGPNRE
jgi:DnaJ-domain-containing protein 1